MSLAKERVNQFYPFSGWGLLIEAGYAFRRTGGDPQPNPEVTLLRPPGMFILFLQEKTQAQTLKYDVSSYFASADLKTSLCQLPSPTQRTGYGRAEPSLTPLPTSPPPWNYLLLSSARGSSSPGVRDVPSCKPSAGAQHWHWGCLKLGPHSLYLSEHLLLHTAKRESRAGSGGIQNLEASNPINKQDLFDGRLSASYAVNLPYTAVI